MPIMRTEPKRIISISISPSLFSLSFKQVQSIVSDSLILNASTFHIFYLNVLSVFSGALNQKYFSNKKERKNREFPSYSFNELSVEKKIYIFCSVLLLPRITHSNVYLLFVERNVKIKIGKAESPKQHTISMYLKWNRKKRNRARRE